MKKIDAKTVLNKAKSKNTKAKVSFTFGETLYNDFREACESQDVSMSRVLEELMKEFLQGLKGK